MHVKDAIGTEQNLTL